MMTTWWQLDINWIIVWFFRVTSGTSEAFAASTRLSATWTREPRTRESLRVQRCDLKKHVKRFTRKVDSERGMTIRLSLSSWSGIRRDSESKVRKSKGYWGTWSCGEKDWKTERCKTWQMTELNCMNCNLMLFLERVFACVAWLFI